MRIAVIGSVVGALLAAGFAAGPARAETSSLYDTLSHKASVKVFVAPFSDVTQDKKVDLAALKSAVEKALTERKSVKFEIVSDKSQAELAVEGSVTELFWSDTDPVDQLAGIGAAAMDAAMLEHYCRLAVGVTVTDLKTNAPVWKDNVLATVTTNDMTRENASTFIYPRFAKVFVANAFGRKKA